MLEQGTPEWRAHRRDHWNASDAPAMMHCSPHESRNDLIARLATGVDREFSDWVEDNVLAPGHAFEARARVLAEALLEDDLARPTLRRGRMSASLDGRSLGGIDWEHKRLNRALRECMPAPGGTDEIAPPAVGLALPRHHRVQIAHTQHCTGAQRTLFSATEWEADGTLVDARHCWVERDEPLIAAIIDGWEQLQHDVDHYVEEEAARIPVAEVLPALPAATIQTSGALAVVSNLRALIPAAREYVARIPTAPDSDDEFATCVAAVKRLREVEVALDAAVANALASVADIEAMQRSAGELREILRARLGTEKLIVARRQQIRAFELRRGADDLDAFVAALNATLAPDRLPSIAVDFAAAVKGLAKRDSLRNAVDAEAARARAVARRLAERIRANAARIERAAAPGLFADRAQLVLRDADALDAIIALRLAEQAKHDAEIAAEAARAAATPAPTPAPAQAATPAPSPAAATAPAARAAMPPVRLALISAAIGVDISERQLQDLGVAASRDERKALTVAAGDLPALRDALLARVQRAFAGA